MPIITCPTCWRRYDPGDGPDDLPANAARVVVCPACGQWVTLPDLQRRDPPAAPPDVLAQMKAQSRLVDAPDDDPPPRRPARDGRRDDEEDDRPSRRPRRRRRDEDDDEYDRPARRTPRRRSRTPLLVAGLAVGGVLLVGCVVGGVLLVRSTTREATVERATQTVPPFGPGGFGPPGGGFGPPGGGFGGPGGFGPGGGLNPFDSKAVQVEYEVRRPRGTGVYVVVVREPTQGRTVAAPVQPGKGTVTVSSSGMPAGRWEVWIEWRADPKGSGEKVSNTVTVPVS